MNITVRIRNKAFWLTAIPTVLLLAQQVAALFGYHMETAGVSAQLVEIVNTVFIVLALVGVCNDPTTAGLGDSGLAMTYERPKE